MKIDSAKSLQEIDVLVSEFFKVFTNANGQTENVKSLKKLMIPEVIIINNTNSSSEVYSLGEFIISREKILNDGSLKEFSEKETFSNTDVNGNIAYRYSHYKKLGVKNSKHFEVEGVKSFQFIENNKGWLIASVVWCDKI
ncbi:hypothetical protein [Psychroserpens sp. SPM9]|uniref:hypothetical protein n=1 Tax=Psychroserpens sp. SPM9 TaxID=2975598 RepID=UPI0021A486A5|nr:hypothetical protein [Psychroserpens sp. SPM9]MDG5492901.1 hypothetical protein [Psychroserpens sp. SPM9]